MKHLFQKQHLEQTPVETEAAKIIKGKFVRLHSHRSLVPSISKYPPHLLVLPECTSYVFLPVCRTGLVRNERTFPWNSYRPRRLRGSSLMYTQVMSLGTTFHDKPRVSTTGSWAHLGQPSATISQSVTQRNTFEDQHSSCLPHEGPCLTDTREDSLPAETWQHFSTSGMRWPPPMLMPCLILGRFWLPWESTTFQNSWSESCSGQLNFFLGRQISGLPKSDHSSAWPLYRMVWDIL